MRAFNAFYGGGVPQLPRPGKYQLRVKRKSIKLVPVFRAPDARKFSISYANIKDIAISYSSTDSSLSTGGAVVGGLVAGGVGAIAGASMGSKKVTVLLAIRFTDFNGVNILKLEGKKLDYAKQMLVKKGVLLNETETLFGSKDTEGSATV